jgi:hypothetical protein
VGDESFITTETLSDAAANFIRGRGTRVFQAFSESSPDRIVVLKDVWLEDDRTEEGVVLQTIRDEITRMKTSGFTFPGDKDPYSYFLTVKAHGRVRVDSGAEDSTVQVMMRGTDLPSDVEYFSTSKLHEPRLRSSRVPGSSRAYSVGHTPQISSEMVERMLVNLPPHTPRFQARIHYRIVFNELGQTIHQLRCLQNLYQCLLDATIGALFVAVVILPYIYVLCGQLWRFCTF